MGGHKNHHVRQQSSWDDDQAELSTRWYYMPGEIELNQAENSRQRCIHGEV